MSLDEIRNFLPLGADISTAGQPSEAQMREIAQAGFVRVINLGLLDPKYCLPDEAQLVACLGMSYCHIPVRFDGPALDDFAAFVTAMTEGVPTPARPVLVHCAANYRVSAFVALYGELHLGWTRAQADQHARRFWQPNPIWSDFLERCRARFIDSSRPDDR